MYCKNCGQELDDKAIVCTSCGVPTDNYFMDQNPIAADDAPSTGFAVLSFFFPLLGLILYLVFRFTHPMHPLLAKSCGKGALAGVITEVVLVILIIIVFGIILVSIDYIPDYMYM